MSAIHVFIQQIFRAAEKATLPPPLKGLCKGLGGSGSFQPEAVSLVMALKPRGLLGFREAKEDSQ
jgi:hypothetical protein